MKRIKWSRDELILVLELYFRSENQFKVAKSDLEEYSKILRAMHSETDRKNPSLRSPASVQMKLRAYIGLDDFWRNQGKKGLADRATKAAKAIWYEFHDKPREVQALAEKIKKAKWYQYEAEADDLLGQSELSEYTEGERRLTLHYTQGRNAALRKSKMADFKKVWSKLFCEVCFTKNTEYEEPIRDHTFEVHHIVPLSEIDEAQTTTISDLAILCANCHRAIHGYGEVPTIQDMRKMLRES